MARIVTVAAAQLGPNQESSSREEIVERMLALLDQAKAQGVELVAYPEMALTTYFPKKIRLPGTKAADGFAQVYEPYYFAHGDTGYKVFDACGAKVGIAICQDRRYPESYRALALQGAEIILIGYNTPISALALDLNELCLRSGAYANACFVVGIAKAGMDDGLELIAGSCVINPQGQVLAKAATSGDELVVSRIDLDHMVPVRKRWNFLGRRQPQHYGQLLQPVIDKEL